MSYDFIYYESDLNNLKLINLNKIERLVISYTYGFNDKPELSYKQIGNLLNMQEKEIKKIHTNALKIIKNDL